MGSAPYKIRFVMETDILNLDRIVSQLAEGYVISVGWYIEHKVECVYECWNVVSAE